MSQDKGSDKRGASYLHNLTEILVLAQQSDLEAIRQHLSALHYNEIRKIKVKLTSLVEGHTEPVGRKKPELIESVVRFFAQRESAGDLEVVAAGIARLTGAAAEPKKKSRRSSKRTRHPEEANQGDPPQEQPQGAPAEKTEKARKRIKQTKRNSLVDSMIESISRNEFSVSAFDMFALPDCGVAVHDEQLSALGAALQQNTHLRSLVLPHLACGNSQMESVMKPAIEADGTLGLESLDIRNNDLTRKVGNTLGSFVGKCPLLKELRVEGNKLGDKLEFIKTLSEGLRVLSIGNLTDKSASVLAKWIAQSSRLTRLTIVGKLKEDTLTKIAKAIAEGNSIQMLVLKESDPISDAVCDQFLQSKSLVYAAGEGAQNDNLQKQLRARASEGVKGHPSALLRELLFSNTGYHSVSSDDTLTSAMRYLAAGAVVPISEELDKYTAGPLQLACTYWGDGQMTEILLSAEHANANELESNQRNLAMRVPKLSPQNLRVLLENGLQADAVDSNGVPLIVAAVTYAWQSSKGNDSGGWLQRLQLLINAEAPVNQTDGDGETALTVISRTPYSSLMILLLSSGADISHTNNQGLTPLHCACRYGHPESVQTLLKYGADINAQDAGGDTPLDVATYFRHGDIVALLRSSEAKHGENNSQVKVMDTDDSDQEHNDCVIF